MNTTFERSAGKEEWLTPRFIIDALGPFDLDPCASKVRPWSTAHSHLTVEDNGLIRAWRGFVWCNPPYGRETIKWLRRMCEHDNGIALTFARTETKMFAECVWVGADAVFFLFGRLSFCDTNGKCIGVAGAPSVLIAYGATAVHRLKQAAALELLDGQFIDLR